MLIKVVHYKTSLWTGLQEAPEVRLWKNATGYEGTQQGRDKSSERKGIFSLSNPGFSISARSLDPP